MTTGYICRRCGNPVYKSDLEERGYSFQCFYCDEDLFGFEVTEEENYGMDVRADAAARLRVSRAAQRTLRLTELITRKGKKAAAKAVFCFLRTIRRKAESEEV